MKENKRMYDMDKDTTEENNRNKPITSGSLEVNPATPINTSMKNNEGENSIEQAVARQQELIQDKDSKPESP